MEEIIAAPTENDFITFEIKSVEPISVAKKYAGVGASLIARIKNTRTPFSIDFGVGMLLFLSRKTENSYAAGEFPGTDSQHVFAGNDGCRENRCDFVAYGIFQQNEGLLRHLLSCQSI